ncbi:MAG: DUF4332 domain-containing protein [Hyphomicrobiales bacterium]|nr:DUF4332 domain-containing protein [Hyphomicrobiales bacterium]
MIYLIFQLGLYLLIAAILGGIIGYQYGRRRSSETQEENVDFATELMRAGDEDFVVLEGRDIQEVEGIGAGYSRRLKALGIKDLAGLLRKGLTEKGVKEMSGAVRIDGAIVQKWVAMTDLLRVPGMNGQFAELLQASGIGSVQQLAKENPSRLAKTIVQVNQKERRMPEADMPERQVVRQWIDNARPLKHVL